MGVPPPGFVSVPVGGAPPGSAPAAPANSPASSPGNSPLPETPGNPQSQALAEELPVSPAVLPDPRPSPPPVAAAPPVAAGEPGAAAGSPAAQVARLISQVAGSARGGLSGRVANAIDEVYDEVRATISDVGDIDSARAIELTMLAMVAVERLKQVDKKEVVTHVILRILEEIPDEGLRTQVALAARLFLPAVIDGVVSAARGELEIGAPRESRPADGGADESCCFGWIRWAP